MMKRHLKKYIIGRNILDFNTDEKVTKEKFWKKLATLTPILFPMDA